jgi:protein-S-isoprenylcysteine O-methyltransferase Ste14
MTFLRYFLPVYFVLFVGLAFVWRTYLVWKRSGHNPYRLGGSDSPHDYIGAMFRGVLLVCTAVIAVYVLQPNLYVYLEPFSWLELPALLWTGVVLLTAALAWTLVAQADMGLAWRVGIDAEVRTDLVQRGLFRISRNPIFLGMRAMLLGLFLTLPNACTLAALLVGETLMQIQVRLEEQHLRRVHGAAFDAYCGSTRRWI